MTPGDSFIGLRQPAPADRGVSDRELRLGAGVRHLLKVFAQATSSMSGLPEGLAALCRAAPVALGARGASAWIHDRQARELVLAATTGATGHVEGTRVPADGPGLPAVALRGDRARWFDEEPGGSGRNGVSIPLRGRRRALGVLVVEGLDPRRACAPHLLAHADELGHRLSSAIENLLLLKDVVASRQQLAQADKLASLGRFVAGIAHELNNPLQGVIGHLDLLQRQGRVPPGIRRELATVAREAGRAARIVNSLLLFAGGKTAPRRPIRLNALVSATIALRRAACRQAKIAVVTDLDAGQPRVIANRTLLQQALLNILVNAEQVLGTGGGGRIIVTTSADTAGGAVRLQVRDTGPGVASAALPHVFEPFFSTKGVGRGTGLGLATAYGTIREHDGTLAVENHPDGGAVFTIVLPTAANARPAGGRSKQALRRG